MPRSCTGGQAWLVCMEGCSLCACHRCAAVRRLPAPASTLHGTSHQRHEMPGCPTCWHSLSTGGTSLLRLLAQAFSQGGQAAATSNAQAQAGSVSWRCVETAERSAACSCRMLKGPDDGRWQWHSCQRTSPWPALMRASRPLLTCGTGPLSEGCSRPVTPPAGCAGHEEALRCAAQQPATNWHSGWGGKGPSAQPVCSGQ